MFGQSVRTNNDVEGWHQKLNAETHPSTGLYHLSSILNTEARQLKLNMRLLSEGKVCRHQRANAQEIHTRLTVQWDRYRSEEITAMKLLRLCELVYTTHHLHRLWTISLIPYSPLMSDSINSCIISYSPLIYKLSDSIKSLGLSIYCHHIWYSLYIFITAWQHWKLWINYWIECTLQSYFLLVVFWCHRPRVGSALVRLLTIIYKKIVLFALD